MGAFFSGLNALTRTDVIRGCGFEKARVTVTFIDPKTKQSKTFSADFKVRETARMVHWTGYGIADGLYASFNFNESEEVLAKEMYLDEVQTLVLSGTNALDVRNFDIPVNAPSNDRSTPNHGTAWEAERAPNAVFLGYRKQAPKIDSYRLIFPRFVNELRRLEAKGTSNALRWAWLLANVTEGGGRSACVLDSHGYHYIHGGWVYNEKGQFALNSRVRKDKLEFVSVRKNDWFRPGDPEPKKPGERVEIPGGFVITEQEKIK